MEQNKELVRKILKRGYFIQFPEPRTDFESQVKLWRKVLDQALIDMLRGPQHFQRFSEDIEENILWKGLMDWFDPFNEDFQFVAYCAGIEPQYAYRKMDEIINFGIIPKVLQ